MAVTLETNSTLAHASRAVFLDRDGTLNEDPGYLADPALMKLLPGVGEALARLQRAGFKLVVVSNQSGVARGFIDPLRLPEIHERLDMLLKPFGAAIDRYECCVHHPDENCECRKPKPKLLLDGAAHLGIDLARSYMVGDRETDVLAGVAAGCKGSVLVRTGKLRSHPQAVFVAGDLLEAADWIIKQGDPESADS